MTEIKEEIKADVEKAVDYTVHPSHESNREARKRQPWMPVVGAIVAGIILFGAAAFFIY